jgi:hypothetical protein
MGYPTKLLSFLYDFYNITAKCYLKEKIEVKINKKNISIKNDDTSNLRKSIVDIPDLLKANFRYSNYLGNFNKLILFQKKIILN